MKLSNIWHIRQKEEKDWTMSVTWLIGRNVMQGNMNTTVKIRRRYYYGIGITDWNNKQIWNI